MTATLHRPITTKAVRVLVSHKSLWRYQKRAQHSYVVKALLGPGAGYVRWNDDRSKVARHGRTFYIAWRSESRRYAVTYRTGRRAGTYGKVNPIMGWLRRHIPLEIGLTRNANIVPYVGS